MNTEIIDKIAKAYAIEYYNVRGGVELMTDEARNMIEFILRDHLIVEKAEVQERWQDAVSDCLSNDYQTYQMGLNSKTLLEILFPKTFNQEKQ